MQWALFIVGWLVVIVRPRYSTVWIMMLVVAAVLAAIKSLAYPALLFQYLGEGVGAALFFGIVGAIIASFGESRRKKRQQQELDQEIERIRSEAS